MFNDEQPTPSTGASLTYTMKCSDLHKNGHIVIKGHPCKIIDMSISKTGKHDHAKLYIVAIDEDMSPSTHEVEVPYVTLNEYQLVNIVDGFLNLMAPDETSKDDVRLPEGELGEGIQVQLDGGKDLLIGVLHSMGEEQAISYKEAHKDA